MAKGFTKDGKFRPTGNNSRKSSKEKTTGTTGSSFRKITSEQIPKETDLKILNNDMRDIADEIDSEIHNNTKGSIPSRTRINVIKDKLAEIEKADEIGFIRTVSFNPVPKLEDLGVDVTEEDHKRLVHVSKLIEEISDDTDPISQNAKDAGRLVEGLIDERGSLGEKLGNVNNELIFLQNKFSGSFEEHDVDVEPDLIEMFGVLMSLTLITENLYANGSELNRNVVTLSKGYTTRTKHDIETNVDQISESFQTLLLKSDKLSEVANRLFNKIERIDRGEI